jgi:hypothetical protein
MKQRRRNQVNSKAMPGTGFCLHAKASNSKLRTAAAHSWKVSWMAENWPTPDGDRFSPSGN